MANCIKPVVLLAAVLCAAFASAQVVPEQTAAPAQSSPVAFVHVSSASTNNTNHINAFSAAANGSLTPVSGSPIPGDVRSIALNGSYLFGTNGINMIRFPSHPMVLYSKSPPSTRRNSTETAVVHLLCSSTIEARRFMTVTSLVRTTTISSLVSTGSICSRSPRLRPNSRELLYAPRDVRLVGETKLGRNAREWRLSIMNALLRSGARECAHGRSLGKHQPEIPRYSPRRNSVRFFPLRQSERWILQ
jgi:hypothetical protein